MLLGVGSGVAISAYMFLIDFLAPGRPFAGIVAASIALPMIFHVILWRGRRRALQDKLKSGGDDRDEILSRRQQRLSRRERLPRRDGLEAERGIPPVGAEHPSLREARAVEAEITRRVQSHAATPDELLEGVSALVSEIESLCELSVEFSRAVGAIPVAELEKDRKTLQKRQRENTSESLNGQYADALEQVERQLSGLAELENRRELLELRIRTGVNALRQINVDLVRMQGDAALGQINAMVRDRTNELSGYLNDLQQSYQELSEEFGSL
jgi:hypothetical protein